MDNSLKKSMSPSEMNRQKLMLDFQLNQIEDVQTHVPIIEKYCVDTIPSKIVSFNDAIRVANTDRDAIVHFYIYDYMFLQLFRNPDKYIPILKEYNYVIGPDLSQLIEMPWYRRFSNCCMNKAMTAYLQRHGVNIIANVTWSLPDSYSYSFSGIPEGCAIAINSNGVNERNDSKYLWHKGYEEAIKTLKPSLIIRYGQKMPHEHEDISVYFDNQFIKRMRYGS